MASILILSSALSIALVHAVIRAVAERRAVEREEAALDVLARVGQVRIDLGDERLTQGPARQVHKAQVDEGPDSFHVRVLGTRDRFDPAVTPKPAPLSAVPASVWRRTPPLRIVSETPRPITADGATADVIGIGRATERGHSVIDEGDARQPTSARLNSLAEAPPANLEPATEALPTRSDKASDAPAAKRNGFGQDAPTRSTRAIELEPAVPIPMADGPTLRFGFETGDAGGPRPTPTASAPTAEATKAPGGRTPSRVPRRAAILATAAACLLVVAVAASNLDGATNTPKVPPARQAATRAEPVGPATTQKLPPPAPVLVRGDDDGAEYRIGPGFGLALRATDTLYVRVDGADGATLFEDMLEPGQEQNFLSNGPLRIRVGNASVAQIVVNGDAPIQLPLTFSPYNLDLSTGDI